MTVGVRSFLLSRAGQARQSGKLSAETGQAGHAREIRRQLRHGRRHAGEHCRRRRATRPAFSWPIRPSAPASAQPPPPKPIIWPRPASGPRLPPPIAFIMSAMPRCIFNSLLIASGVVPEPAAMRFLRLALRMSGLRRSCGVIESMIAICRLRTLSSRLASGDLVLHLGDAGQHAHQAAHAAHASASA